MKERSIRIKLGRLIFLSLLSLAVVVASGISMPAMADAPIVNSKFATYTPIIDGVIQRPLHFWSCCPGSVPPAWKSEWC